jgi:hypothetical protein
MKAPAAALHQKVFALRIGSAGKLAWTLCSWSLQMIPEYYDSLIVALPRLLQLGLGLFWGARRNSWCPIMDILISLITLNWQVVDLEYSTSVPTLTQRAHLMPAFSPFTEYGKVLFTSCRKRWDLGWQLRPVIGGYWTELIGGSHVPTDAESVATRIWGSSCSPAWQGYDETVDILIYENSVENNYEIEEAQMQFLNTSLILIDVKWVAMSPRLWVL